MVRVLHVAFGAYPNEKNPVAGIFVKKLVSLQIKKGINCHVLEGTYSFLSLFRSNIEIMEDERIVVRYQRGINKLPNIIVREYLKRLSRLFLSTVSVKPDIIHCHFAFNAPVGQALSKELDSPYIVTLHENHWWYEELLVKQPKLHKQAIVESSLVTRPNSIDIIDLYKWDLPHEKIAYLQNYVDETSFEIPSEKERRNAKERMEVSEKQIIINVASLHKKKGHRLLIQAFSILSKRIPNLELWIIGEGPEKKILNEQVKELRLDKLVRFMGRIENNRIKHYLSCADVFAMPSISESFGISQVEAMLTGLPVVSTRNFGSEEIVINGVNGFVCRDRDPVRFSSLLEKALAMNWDRERIRNTAVQRYGGDTVNKKILDLYSKAIARYRCRT